MAAADLRSDTESILPGVSMWWTGDGMNIDTDHNTDAKTPSAKWTWWKPYIFTAFVLAAVWLCLLIYAGVVRHKLRKEVSAKLDRAVETLRRAVQDDK